MDESIKQFESWLKKDFNPDKSGPYRPRATNAGRPPAPGVRVPDTGRGDA